MSLRGILRGFGLKVGKTSPRTFASRVRKLVTCHPTLLLVAEALLAARAALGEQLSKLEKRVRSLARDERRVRRLMSAPGVGAVVAPPLWRRSTTPHGSDRRRRWGRI